MKEIKNIEEIINLCKEDLDKNDENVTAILGAEDLKSLRNLLDRNKELEYKYNRALSDLVQAEHKNKELEEENTVLKKANNISENTTVEDITNFMNKSLEDFNKEHIPVSLVEEKIKELIKEGRHYNANKIEVLQELLEG